MPHSQINVSVFDRAKAADSLLGGIARMTMITKIVVRVLVAFIVIMFLLMLLPLIHPSRKLHAGMTMSQVREALGPPQEVRTNDNIYPRWTYRHWYGKVSIGFDTNGIIGSWISDWPEPE